MGGPTMTIPTQPVPAAPVEDPRVERYGLELGEAARLPSGTVYPILPGLVAHGWLAPRWEDIDASAEGRPARGCDKLAADGVQASQVALALAHRPSTARRLRPLPGRA